VAGSTRPGGGEPDAAAAAPLAEIGSRVPAAALGILSTLWQTGHAAYVVGGCLRDTLLGREPADWDVTTDAAPDRIAEIFPRALYENRFGTVVVHEAGSEYEVTAFRRDVSYSDFRHPDAVEFGSSIEEDLARRDFTVNALAWGAAPGGTPGLVDLFRGREDLDAKRLRAVGDPDRRFAEDALRMVRAVRLAATLGFEVDPETLASIGRNAGLGAHLSGERITTELLKLLGAPRPSIGLRLMAETGLLAVILPELDRQRGLGQNKIPGEDLWDHTVRSVDAAPNRRVVRLATLLHDVGKPDTLADGHFLGHDRVGADMAVEILSRLHCSRALQEDVARLVLNHMFSYQPNWTDAAVRRFIRKIGPGTVWDLLDLREADNAGSGLPAGSGDLADLRARLRHEMAGPIVLGRAQLKVNGTDLMTELRLPPGKELGLVLEALTERVVADPKLNRRKALIELARELVASGRRVDNPDLD
jgi:tRNA nucleotidyltransferase (CCA-adding enzyme)